MAAFIIAETDSGLTVAEWPEGVTAEEAAERAGGVLVDRGPYSSYEDANDALVAIQREELDEDELRE